MVRRWFRRSDAPHPVASERGLESGILTEAAALTDDLGIVIEGPDIEADLGPEPPHERFDLETPEGLRKHREFMTWHNRRSIIEARHAGCARWEFGAYAGCCPTCAELDGKRFSVDDLTHLPPVHDGCRCHATADVDGPVLDDD